MGRTSTLIYLYSNFDDSQIITSGEDDSVKLDRMIDFIEENTKKVPDRIVDNIIQFARNYS